jgi:putative spermidine/putrescine transport system ATP-binding protein
MTQDAAELKEQRAILELKALHKSYNQTSVVRGIEFRLQRGELLTLLGASGCGKTTTLRMIGGFLEATSGQILLDGKDVTHLPPAQRDTSMVFQNYALFPHLTAAQNIAFGLQRRKVAKHLIAEKVARYLTLLKLDGLGDRLPKQLSGGQQQRVAVARALAVEPSVLLMDEPFSNLDAGLRQSTATELRRLQQQIGTTVVLVTHDKEEALAISDRVAVLSNGVLEQIGSAKDVYERPSTRFVADFASKSNIFEGTVSQVSNSAAVVDVAGVGQVRVPFVGALSAGQAVAVAVRPEVMATGQSEVSSARRNRVDGIVKSTTYLGNAVRLVLKTSTGQEISCLTLGSRVEGYEPGAPIAFSWAEHEGVLLLH